MHFLTENLSPIKVLLVEDHLGDAQLVQEALRANSDLQFKVLHVDRFAAALKYLVEVTVNVIILDLKLPDAQGLDTLLKIYAAAPKIPIIVLTGMEDQTLARKAMQYGAQDYLSKNQMDGRLLAHSICHAIERHHLHAKLDQQRAENQKLQSLGMLAGGIAHDFNNLLAIILGKADLARRETKTPFVKEALEQIKNASNRATEFCKQLLAYAGKGRFVPLLYNLNKIIQEMAPTLQRSISNHIGLNYQLSEDFLRIKADLTQIHQLMMNLILNAAEAIGNEQGTITIRTGLLYADRDRLLTTSMGENLAEGDYVYLEIADTGCGIDPQTQTQIFEPFFSTKFIGRGLGLSAVLGIVRTHKGTLEITTGKDRGSMFRILLPASPATKSAPSSAKSSTNSDSSGNKILVIDDEESIRAVLGEMLKELGFEVLFAKNGLEGIEIYSQNKTEIALAMLDMTMPQMNGKEVYQKILQIKPHAAILLMSGYSETKEDFSENKETTGFIQKPFQFDELRSKIQHLLLSHH